MKIVQVLNTIISQKEKISNVIRDDDTFYFFYDTKYKWSVSLFNNNYLVRFYPKDDVELSEIPNQLIWENYKDFVTYSSDELKTREAHETFAELYQVVANKLYGIDDIFDSIIDEDIPF